MRPRALFVFVPIALSTGCRTPTDVQAEVSTDVDCTKLQSTTITIGDGGDIETKPATASTSACGVGASDRIGSITIVPSAAKDASFAFKIVAGVDVQGDACTPPDYKGCIVARRALRFVPHTELDLPVMLRGVCLNQPCDPQTTCVQGQCVPATIDDPSKCATPGFCDESILVPTGSSTAASSSGVGGAGASGGAAATGGAGGGAGGSLGVGGASSTSAGAGGATTGCPSGMIAGTTAAGKAYCIDSFETTRAQYRQFLAATNDGASIAAAQPPYCTWNTSFVPDPTCEASACIGACDQHPQVCVDWCDAFAYCAWAGKRLCGDVDPATKLPLTGYADPNQSEWFDACTGGNASNVFPYGPTYEPVACNGADYGANGTVPVGSDTGCQGGLAGLYDMSGNVWEWEDSCNQWVGKADNCRARGGGWISVGTLNGHLVCNADLVDKRNRVDQYSGLRCCL